MKQYLALLQKVIESGDLRPNRTGINTYSLFGESLKMDLRMGFPLLTTKRVFYKGVFGELIWMLRGETNIDFLVKNEIHIWDKWADAHGNLGPVYGKQWRNWDGVDQIRTVCDLLKNDPFSRRIILSTWNVGELNEMRLPPCHVIAQFYIRNGFLDCAVYQRSGDIFLGVPFDIASYAALVHLLAWYCGYKPGKLTYNFGDVHLYENHFAAALEQLQRQPGVLPRLSINPQAQFWDLQISDFVLSDYNPQPTIKADVAV